MDIAEFVSDYVQCLKDCGERIPPRKQLAKQIATALEDYDIKATPAQIEYYL